MTPLITRHMFDPHGTNRDNLVLNEPQPLRTIAMRTLIPTCGTFYEKNLRVYDPSTQRDLIPKIQYKLQGLNVDVMAETGYAAYGSIVVIDTDVTAPELLITYQAVGGKWGNSLSMLEKLFTNVENDTRAVNFHDLYDLPADWIPYKHFHDLGDPYGFDPLTFSLERVLAAQRLHDIISHDLIYRDVDLRIGDLNTAGSQYALSTMAAHDTATNPHTQYLLKENIAQYIQPIRRPINIAPSAGAVDVLLDVTLLTDAYHSMYRVPHLKTQFQVSSRDDFSIIEVDASVATPALNYHYGGVLSPNSVYYWRSRFTDVEDIVSDWSPTTSFKTVAVSVTQPTIVTPANNTESGAEDVTIVGSTFSVQGAADAHASTDWEVWTGPNGTGNRVYSSQIDTVNLTRLKVPLGTLTRETYYYPRCRYRSARFGTSPWSLNSRFYATWPLRPTVLGQAFQGGFWGGDIVLPDGTYAIIVAPKASGEKMSQLMTHDQETTGAYSDTDSMANTNALVAAGAVWVAKGAADWVKTLTIGGYSDWAIPARSVLAKMWTNLRDTSSLAPAIYKNGGLEAFRNNYPYWSSTAHDWIRDDSYQTGGNPIYEERTRLVQKTVTSTWVGSNWSDNQPSPPPHPSPDSACSKRPGGYVQAGASVLYPSVDMWDTQPGWPANQRFASGVTVIYCAMDTVEWVEEKYMEIVGYTPVVDHPVFTPVWRAWSKSFSDVQSADGEELKTTSRLVRAVRMVKVA